MSQTVISTGTVTYAIKGRDLLKRKGYQAKVIRHSSAAGCGYGIAFSGDRNKAEALLREAGVKILDIQEA
ncbi:MAG: DUF3343 domain-containing protein [Clostridia bacterium]|nr:DUF3343 domain-containing protein [Clostridia bacterium]